VSYNGRGFDWPLLVTRYRMTRNGPPPHAGHLDLLPLVRRLFRHRLDDARLRTVEISLLGLERHEDVDGWEIPGRYLDFLRTGLAAPLVAVARHNAEDVRSLARLIAVVEACLGSSDARRSAHAGDLAGLARLFLRDGQLDVALECLEAALDRGSALGRGTVREAPAAFGSARPAGPEPVAIDDWWSPRRRPDFGGRPEVTTATELPRLASPWSEERLLVERAHVLRRLGRVDEAARTWSDLAVGSTRQAAVAAIELAKLREHRLRDLDGALEAARRAWAILDRRRRLGRPEARLEADLVRRGARLRMRLRARAVAARGVPDEVRSAGWTSHASTSTVASPS
jgi:tetratricopeptide (TPR) repeat protein